MGQARFPVLKDLDSFDLGVRLILVSKLGKMTVNEERPEMLPAIA